MRIYLACGLTHVPRDQFSGYVRLLHSLAGMLEVEGHQVRYALRDSDPQLAEKPIEDRARLCYLWDRAMVEWADIVIAECSYPSIGMGIELQIAEAGGTPTILCFHRTLRHKAESVDYENPDETRHTLQIGDGFVSLMALGLPTVFKVVAYPSYEKGIPEIVQVVRLLDRSDGP